MCWVLPFFQCTSNLTTSAPILILDYHHTHTPTMNESSISPSVSGFDVDDIVVIDYLEQATHYNGKRAVVVKRNTKDGRVGVAITLRGGVKHLALRPLNLRSLRDVWTSMQLFGLTKYTWSQKEVDTFVREGVQSFYRFPSSVTSVGLKTVAAICFVETMRTIGCNGVRSIRRVGNAAMLTFRELRRCRLWEGILFDDLKYFIDTLEGAEVFRKKELLHTFLFLYLGNNCSIMCETMARTLQLLWDQHIEVTHAGTVLESCENCIVELRPSHPERRVTQVFEEEQATEALGDTYRHEVLQLRGRSDGVPGADQHFILDLTPQFTSMQHFTQVFAKSFPFAIHTHRGGEYASPGTVHVTTCRKQDTNDEVIRTLRVVSPRTLRAIGRCIQLCVQQSSSS